jgi:hypothetical protein
MKTLACVRIGVALVWLAGLSACSSSGENAGPAEAGVPSDAAPGDAGLVFSAIGTPSLVGNQFYFTEGPVWNPDAGVLYFTDINKPQGDGAVGDAIYRLTPPASVDVYFQPSGNADGLALDRQGSSSRRGSRRATYGNSRTTRGSCSLLAAKTRATKPVRVPATWARRSTRPTT